FRQYFETLRNEILSEFDGIGQSIRGVSESEIRSAENKFNITLPTCYVDWLKVFGENVIDIIDNSAGNYTLKDFIFANTKMIEIKKKFNIPEAIKDWVMIGIYIEGYVFTGFNNTNNTNEIGLFHVPDLIDGYKKKFVPFIRNHLINSVWENIVSDKMISKGKIPENGKWAWNLVEYEEILKNHHYKYGVYEKVDICIDQIEQHEGRFLTIEEVVLQKKELAEKLIK
ncbi:MAG: SMI1/KNR4 family protein, partial [Saprospiraceae bacterium]|nr:SMI1/KNR4 family protein [Saprospiraceae bacterium]